MKFKKLVFICCMTFAATFFTGCNNDYTNLDSDHTMDLLLHPNEDFELPLC